LSLYSKKLLTIASGATTIGSTGRAPDDDRKYQLSRIINFSVDMVKSVVVVSLPSGEICNLLKKQLDDFIH
jgi:hypothetical protein